MGTTVACRCGVFSSMCNTHDTRLSSPNVSLSHLRLAPIQLSSLPSLAIFIICSCVPVRIMRMAFVWFLPTLRRNPAVLMRCCIASVRLDTPSGNLTSSLFRGVLPASAFAGTYFFPLESFLSIWHDIPESFPLPRCKWQTAYCVLLILYLLYDCCFCCKIPSCCRRHIPGSRRFPSAYGLFDCRTRSGGGENALISYGILQPLFHGTASCPIPFRHSVFPASTSSSPKVSMKVCNTGLRSIIFARIICGVPSTSRKSAMSSP